MSSTRLLYDDCASKQRTVDSTSLVNYYFYKGAHENCTDCNMHRLDFNEPSRPGTIPLVDIESELEGRNRPQTKCDQFKYHPNCNKQNFCINKNDTRIAQYTPPDVCFYTKLAWNNIRKPTDPGYRLPKPNVCPIPGKSVSQIGKTQIPQYQMGSQPGPMSEQLEQYYDNLNKLHFQ